MLISKTDRGGYHVPLASFFGEDDLEIETVRSTSANDDSVIGSPSIAISKIPGESEVRSFPVAANRLLVSRNFARNR